jgi:hypothetical protein
MQVVENHRRVASSCFNRVWDLLDLPERSKHEEEQMVHLAHTSFWHWTQVDDHTPTNLSVGYWQLSRVYAVVGNGVQAQYYANRCVEVSIDADLPPFYIGYGYEALARSYVVLGEFDSGYVAIKNANHYTDKVMDEGSKKLLEADLKQIKELLSI